VLATLGMPRPKTGQFLDMVLYSRAKSAGKSIFGLETVEEQISIFEDTPIADQIQMIKESLDFLPELPQRFEAMIVKYLAGDLKGIMASVEQEMKAGDPEVAERFYRRLNQERNLRMMEGIIPRLGEGNAFIAVGALHLAGSEGLLQLLEQRGYTVQAIN